MKNILTVSNLNKSFNNKKVLQDVNFSIPKGKIVGLVGPNGAGKTTIMKSILALTTSTGEISILGESVSFSSHKTLASVGALIETPAIYPFLSGLDHLKLFANNRTNQAAISQLISALKMDSYIKKKAKSYSLGMKQKLGIALALLNQPELVILDEPMNGLDPQANKDVRDLLLKLKESGVTFLISSHILSELQKVADDLLIINHGEIVQETTMSDILSANQYLVISTNDDSQAKKLLTQHGFSLTDEQEIKVKKEQDATVSKVISLLEKNGLEINDISHQHSDLESSLLKLLSQDQDKEEQ
ncbi:ATP-binding cassette domain-containing protein [Ligilactobacillus pobuzihii]|uniref:ABC transporter ATP-binding protein n=1 Tax=Ligilactobacillus pobuzihii TaxID=449659 RepID=UPI0019D31D86|nr:ATP-binding cassette domain-containing protein [Ligilactobacillus pobuzihii]MBN7274360.1 ATP-binding cassette domain-containing protein [Ligilactobacillus pobuzihii]